jgi:hypothetical protein
LRSLRLIEERAAVQKFSAFDGPRAVAWAFATRFRATPRLLALAAEQGVRIADAGDHFATGLPERPLVLRAGSKRHRWGQKVHGKLMKFERTGGLQAMEQQIRDLNAFLTGFDLSGGTHRGYTRRFNLGDHPAFQWNLGGRLYSQGDDSYQHMPSEQRLKMIIDGEPVCELDIRASYLTIFHAQRGHPLDLRHDPYRLLPNSGEEGRDVVKSFIAATFGNSEFPRKWPTQRASDFFSDTGRRLSTKYPIKIVREAVAQAYPLLTELKRDDARPPVWGELMFVESNAIVKTMLALMNSGIPSLSVHDSLIVPQREENTATELLCSIYEAETGARPAIRCKTPG